MTIDLITTKKLRAEINVTPLVDVVLVLLIIFMVLTPSTLKYLTANVPKHRDESTPVIPAETSIIVEYTSARTLTLDSKPVAPEALAEMLTERLRGAPQKVVYFKAADDAPYGEVVRLMDVARGAGAQTLALVTQ